MGRTLTPDLLHRALIALFGNRYQSDAAKACGVSVKTIERNVGGVTKVSHALEDKVIELLFARKAADKELLRLLRQEKWKTRHMANIMTKTMKREMVAWMRRRRKQDAKALRAPNTKSRPADPPNP